MLIEIDRQAGVPVYVQIHHQLRELILSGTFFEESRLPPTRKLAKALDVNRATVRNAYLRLWGEGLVEGRSGAGTVVLPQVPLGTHAAEEERPLLSWETLLAERAAPATDRVLSGVAASRADAVSFAASCAGEDVCAELGVQEVLARPVLGSSGLVGTPHAQGDLALRKLLSERMGLAGIRATPSQVLVLSSPEQGIHVVARALLNRGDGVAIASPTCPATLRALASAGAKLHLAPMDSEGIRLDVAEGILTHLRPKLFLVESSFHNPTGTTLSVERRRALLELAYRFRVPLLEHDTCSEIRYSGRAVPPLATLDTQGHVLHLATCQVLPSLRIAWLVAPQRVARHLALVKSSCGLDTSGLTQVMATAFLPWLDGHLDKILQAFQSRRDAACGGLERHCHGLIRFSRPEGGFFLWGELQRGLTARALLDEAHEEGVSFAPGSAFYPDGKGGNRALRLNFAAVGEAQIRTGVERLGRAVRAALTSSDATPQADRRPRPAVQKRAASSTEERLPGAAWGRSKLK